MATTEFEIDLAGMDGLEEVLDRIDGGILSKELMEKIGSFALTKIKLRTSEGVDADDKSFKPYSPGYALFREKAGHPSSTVNLFFSGSMMSAMTYDFTDSEVKLYFLNTTDTEDVRNPDKAFWQQEKGRKFFALSEEDIATIMEIVNEYYKELVNG